MTTLVDRKTDLLKRAAGRSVVHIGCADWPYTQRRLETGMLLHEDLSNVASRLVGIDISQEAVDILSEHRSDWDLRVYDSSFEGADETFDVIVAAEVIEHVANVGGFLEDLHRYASSNTELVITTPNAYSFKGAVRAWVNREYAHPDHVVIFSEKVLSQVLLAHGWEVQEVVLYDVRSESALKGLLSTALRFASRVSSVRLGDGLIVVAKSQRR